MINNKLLKERVISSFGISIPTGLALESVFDPTTERYDKTRVIPVRIDIKKYNTHYINIYTLARNVINAAVIPKDKLNSLFSNDELMRVVIEEINIISNLYNNTDCKLVIYIPDYTPMLKYYNEHKEVETAGLNYDIINYVNVMINKNSYEVFTTVYSKFDLPRSHDNILITTHIAADLLNYERIPNLQLLESHTGKLKKRTDWYSKYHKIGKLDMSFFPFSKELLYILGDGIISLPMKLSIRRSLHEIAVKYKWTYRTQPSTIREKLLAIEEFKDILTKIKI